jgi:hypothetical protein
MRSTPSRPDQSGSVAVTVALVLTLLLGVMAFSMDTGYLYLKKNQYQNAVEAAAMAGAIDLCGDDPVVTARRIAAENGIADAGELTVGFGYYDETDRYADFSVYKDFAAEDDMPAGEYINAVLVAYRSTPTSLTGMGQDKQVGSTAVAYLQRIDFASLDVNGEIQLGHDSSWDGVTFFSNGDIKYPQSTSAGGATYNVPEFTDCQLLVVGQVMSCPVDVVPFGLFSERMEIKWGDGAVQSDSGIRSGVAPLTDIRPVDDDYLDQWRLRADTIYTPDQAGQDDIFYGQSPDSVSPREYYINPAGFSGSLRRTIFLDCGGDADAVAILGPWPRSYTSDRPNGNGFTIANITFVTTCNVEVQNSTPGHISTATMHVGGEGEEQAVVISAGDIKIWPGTGGGVVFDGAVFRVGGDFIKEERGSKEDLQRIRVIADGTIRGKNYSLYAKDPGVNNFWNDSRFGPPCPPVRPKLGRLVYTE